MDDTKWALNGYRKICSHEINTGAPNERKRAKKNEYSWNIHTNAIQPALTWPTQLILCIFCVFAIFILLSFIWVVSSIGTCSGLLSHFFWVWFGTEFLSVSDSIYKQFFVSVFFLLLFLLFISFSLISLVYGFYQMPNNNS